MTPIAANLNPLGDLHPLALGCMLLVLASYVFYYGVAGPIQSWYRNQRRRENG